MDEAERLRARMNQLLAERKEEAEQRQVALEQITAAQNDLRKPKCPRCKSQNFTIYGKKFSTGKAMAGAAIGTALLGPIGLIGAAAGNTNKVEFICLDCGKKWKK